MLKEFIIYFFSILTCIGVPILIYLIHSRNKTEINLILNFIDPDILRQVNEFKKEKLQQNREIKNYLESLETQIINAPNKIIEERISKLNNWKTKLIQFKAKSEKVMIKLSKDIVFERGDVIHMMHSSMYIKRSTEIIIKIDELIAIENSQKND